MTSGKLTSINISIFYRIDSLLYFTYRKLIKYIKETEVLDRKAQDEIELALTGFRNKSASRTSTAKNEEDLKLREYRDGILMLLRYIVCVMPDYIDKDDIRQSRCFRSDSDFNHVCNEVARFAHLFIFDGVSALQGQKKDGEEVILQMPTERGENSFQFLSFLY